MVKHHVQGDILKWLVLFDQRSSEFLVCLNENDFNNINNINLKFPEFILPIAYWKLE